MTTKQILKEISQDLMINRKADSRFIFIEFCDYDTGNTYYQVYRNSHSWWVRDYTNLSHELQEKGMKDRCIEVGSLQEGIQTVSDLIAIDMIYDNPDQRN